MSKAIINQDSNITDAQTKAAAVKNLLQDNHRSLNHSIAKDHHANMKENNKISSENLETMITTEGDTAITNLINNSDIGTEQEKEQIIGTLTELWKQAILDFEQAIKTAHVHLHPDHSHDENPKLEKFKDHVSDLFKDIKIDFEIFFNHFGPLTEVAFGRLIETSETIIAKALGTISPVASAAITQVLGTIATELETDGAERIKETEAEDLANQNASSTATIAVSTTTGASSNTAPAIVPPIVDSTGFSEIPLAAPTEVVSALPSASASEAASLAQTIEDIHISPMGDQNSTGGFEHMS